MGGEHAWKYPVMFELAPACGGGWSGGRGVLSTAVAIATAGGWCQTAASPQSTGRFWSRIQSIY